MVAKEIFERLRLENHHRDRQARFAAFRGQFFDHRAMAQMQTVEIADRQHAAAFERLQVREAANYSHDERRMAMNGTERSAVMMRLNMKRRMATDAAKA